MRWRLEHTADGNRAEGDVAVEGEGLCVSGHRASVWGNGKVLWMSGGEDRSHLSGSQGMTLMPILKEPTQFSGRTKHLMKKHEKNPSQIIGVCLLDTEED